MSANVLPVLLTPEEALTIVPLLDPSVETLSDYGHGTAVRLRDRQRRLRILAWPSGERTVALGPAEASGDQETAVSEVAGHTWTFNIRGRTTRSYDIEAWVGFMGNGNPRPCSIRAIGALTPPRWSYDPNTGVLDLHVRGRRIRVLVRTC